MFIAGQRKSAFHQVRDIALMGRRRFNPRTLFSQGEQGAWYDPSDITSMYQDSAGTTAAAINQPVGLLLDKRLGMVRGAEMAYAGYATPAAHDNITTATSASSFTQTAGTTVGRSYLDLVTVVGQWYEVVALTTGPSSGNVALYARDGSGGSGTILATSQLVGASTTQQRIVFRATTTASNILWVTSVAGTICSATGITIRSLAGNHATQSTSASRPTLSARYNLFLATEALATQSLTIPATAAHRLSIMGTGSVALTGATTGNLAGTGAANRVTSDFTLNGVLATPVISSVTTSTAGGTLAAATLFSYRVAAKDAAGRTLASTAVTVTTGAGATNSNTVNWTAITGATGGYDVFGRTDGGELLIAGVAAGVVTYTDTGAITPAGALPAANTTGITTFTVTGSVTKADIRTVADSGLVIPIYQRVTTSTDYDTAGFPMYLKFDGVDDGMVTGSIDFSATDKMTAWAGVYKASDAAIACLVEHGDTIDSFLFAPRTAAGSYGSDLRGGGLASTVTSTTYNAPISNVVTVQMDRAAATIATEITHRVNGAAPGASASSGTGPITGNFTSNPLYIGRRNSASLPFNGRIYSLIVRGAATDTPTTAATEKYTGSKTGIILP